MRREKGGEREPGSIGENTASKRQKREGFRDLSRDTFQNRPQTETRCRSALQSFTFTIGGSLGENHERSKFQIPPPPPPFYRVLRDRRADREAISGATFERARDGGKSRPGEKKDCSDKNPPSFCSNSLSLSLSRDHANDTLYNIDRGGGTPSSNIPQGTPRCSPWEDWRRLSLNGKGGRNLGYGMGGGQINSTRTPLVTAKNRKEMPHKAPRKPSHLPKGCRKTEAIRCRWPLWKAMISSPPFFLPLPSAAPSRSLSPEGIEVTCLELMGASLVREANMYR